MEWLTIIAVAILLAVISLRAWRLGGSVRARQRPPHDHTTENTPPARGAWKRRPERPEPRSLRTLSGDERARYVQQWRQLQLRAAAQPATALLDADELLTRLLDSIGYPTGMFVQYAADLSAVHAGVVDDYRSARNVVLDTRLGLACTPEIRHAMLRYRRVFEHLAGADVSAEADETAA